MNERRLAVVKRGRSLEYENAVCPAYSSPNMLRAKMAPLCESSVVMT